jgi:hypothetical protein
VTPVIDRRYPLSEAQAAITYLEEGHARGKVVIVMDGETPVDAARLKELATQYTAAWCSGDAAKVAGFYSEGGSLKINAGAPSVGRSAIAKAAQGFMTAFPDLVVTMDGVDFQHDRVIYRWSLKGTNTARGAIVQISGREEWKIGADGLIAESLGHFDEAEYERQLGTRRGKD